MFWAYVPIVKCLGIVAVKNYQHNKGSHNTDYTPGLIILEPHISNVLNGHKTIELRKQNHTKHIGKRIALLEGGFIRGYADLVDVIHYPSKKTLIKDQKKHRAAEWMYSNDDFSYRYGYVLKNVKKLKKPKPYKHPQGAQIWVKLPKKVGSKNNPQLNEVVFLNNDNRFQGSLIDYLDSIEITDAEKRVIIEKWNNFNVDEHSFRKYFSFDSPNYDYVMVFREELTIDPNRIRFSIFNQYRDPHWDEFWNMNELEKLDWAKKQWQKKGHVPLRISIDRSLAPYVDNGHHRIMAAKLLGIHVPCVIQNYSYGTYEEAKNIIVNNVSPLY